MNNIQNIESALEALLFVSTDVISENQLAEILDTDVVDVHDSLQGLQKRYEVSDSGIILKKIAGGWRLYSNPEYYDLIQKYVLSQDSRKLTQAALETLAIIAYSQPVSRAGVASGRGVNSDSSINSLLEKGLIRELGQANLPGNPMTYGTTPLFLEHFGFGSLKELTPIEQFAPDDKTREIISERLSATRITSDDQLSPFDANDFDYEEQSDEGMSQNTSKSNIDPKKQEAVSRSQDILSQALAEALGTTEKVDLEKLKLYTDDE